MQQCDLLRSQPVVAFQPVGKSIGQIVIDILIHVICQIHDVIEYIADPVDMVDLQQILMAAVAVIGQSLQLSFHHFGIGPESFQGDGMAG